ncbi:MAG: FAD-binding oxidoreductase, partial [Nitrospinota bacterium]
GGEVVEVGGKALDEPGYDLTGLLVGSEGLLGIVTKIVVKIVHLPEHIATQLVIFDSLVDAAEAVSAIIAAGLLPTTLEMMDRSVIQVVEAHIQAGYPLDAEAILLIELDGLRDGMSRAVQQITTICQKHGAREVKTAQSDAEREQLWLGRRRAFGAIARLRPSAYTVDGVVPRSKLPTVLAQVMAICEKYHLQAGNVFHAGDGNIHPVILFDERNREETERVMRAGVEILQVCVEAGGTITGEHGVGLEKQREMRLLHTDQDLTMMKAVKDVFDPEGLSNPNKVLPQLISGV